MVPVLMQAAKAKGKPAAKAAKPKPAPRPALSESSTHNAGPGKAIEEIYQKKTQLEHILLRPDTYIGSTEKQQQKMWVHDGTQLVMEEIEYVPGLYKIFDEILVNAADNKVRDPSMDSLKVDINAVSTWLQPVLLRFCSNMNVPQLVWCAAGGNMKHRRTALPSISRVQQALVSASASTLDSISGAAGDQHHQHHQQWCGRARGNPQGGGHLCAGAHLWPPADQLQLRRLTEEGESDSCSVPDLFRPPQAPGSCQCLMPWLCWPAGCMQAWCCQAA